MTRVRDYEVQLLDRDGVDADAWDAHVLATTANPTQLAAFGALGGALRRPVYAQLTRDGEVRLRWLFYVTGLRRGLLWLDIRSEPTGDDPAQLAAVLDAAIARFAPFRIVFDDMVYNRWSSGETLRALGFEQLHEHGTITLDLTQGPEAILAGMRKTHRNRVRRGERAGLKVEEQSDVDGAERAYPLIAATLERGGGHVPHAAYVREHARLLCPGGHARIFFATRDGADHGVIFDFVTRGVALGWLGGTHEDAAPGTGNFLQWRVFAQLSREGVACYDLGAVDVNAPPDSKGARILASKTRYGGELTRHYGGTRTLGRRRAALYDALLRVYRGLR